MKNKIFILSFFLFIISCKKIDNKAVAQIQETNVKILNLPIDSKKINYNSKDKNGFFIYDKTFGKNQYSNSLSRIYGKHSLNKNIDLVFIERKPNDDEYTEPIITIFSYNKNLKIDSLNIFETINSEATVEKRFLIDKSKKIHIYESSVGYDTTENGKDTLIIEKKEDIYTILESGKFVLENQKILASKNEKKNISQTNNNSWNGTYYFEASNRDNAKTVFNIIINSLEDISVNINDDGSQESYLKIKSEKLNNNKIKIVYNSTLENEMGVIYIEEFEGKYYISGTPIYMINPGTTEGEMQKKK